MMFDIGLESLNNKENKKMEFESFKDLIMYYQTSIRNVALLTAVSFAALGYSRFYRGKSIMYSAGMTLVSLLLLTASFLLNIFLYNDVQKYKNLDKYMEIEKWTNVNNIFILIHSIAIFFALYTFYRLFVGKQFSS